MKTTRGKQLTMLMNDKSVYHAESHTLSISPEFETWETKDTDGEEQEFSKVRFTGSANGVICVKEAADKTVNALDTPELIAQALTGSQVTIITKIAIEGTTAVSYTGKAVIDSFEIEETVAKKGTYKVSFKGCGLKPATI
ncbi:MAG: hypothetical protein RR971_04115 [Alistipes sp.]